MLCQSGEANGLRMERFGEIDMREILNQAMTKLHLSQLNHVDWQHYNKPYVDTIAKLETLKPQIITFHESEKRLKDLESALNLDKKTAPCGNSNGKMNDKTGKRTGKTRNGDNKKKSTKSAKSVAKSTKESAGSSWERPKDSNRTSDKGKKRKCEKEMVSVVKEIMDNKDNNFDSSDDEESWKKLTKNSIERAYVLRAAQGDQNCDDNDLSLDYSTAKQYLKRYRKNEKRHRKVGEILNARPSAGLHQPIL